MHCTVLFIINPRKGNILVSESISVVAKGWWWAVGIIQRDTRELQGEAIFSIY